MHIQLMLTQLYINTKRYKQAIQFSFSTTNSVCQVRLTSQQFHSAHNRLEMFSFTIHSSSDVTFCIDLVCDRSIKEKMKKEEETCEKEVNFLERRENWWSID